MSAPVRVTVTNTDGQRGVRIVTTGQNRRSGLEHVVEWITLNAGASSDIVLYPRQHLRVEAIA